MAKRIAKKTVRVQVDPVTHETMRIVLDAERIVGAVDREMMNLDTNPARYRVVAHLIERLEEMLPRTG